MTAFAAMVDALFGNADLARDAVYTPPGGGAGIPCRVVPSRPTAEMEFSGMRISQQTALFDVRQAEVPAPKAEGQLVIGAETFVVQSAPKLDRERLIWTLDTYLLGA
ncbi:MAG: head-tail joining protein [Inquilinus sp.]|uniref:head-tail joining protein n=1 Tax=Inquilinus sp. TaxID=1932117 RepID=UPI003F3993DD